MGTVTTAPVYALQIPNLDQLPPEVNLAMQVIIRWARQFATDPYPATPATVPNPLILEDAALTGKIELDATTANPVLTIEELSGGTPLASIVMTAATGFGGSSIVLDGTDTFQANNWVLGAFGADVQCSVSNRANGMVLGVPFNSLYLCTATGGTGSITGMATGDIAFVFGNPPTRWYYNGTSWVTWP